MNHLSQSRFYTRKITPPKISQIVGKRTNANGKVQYLVNWEPSWEYSTHVDKKATEEYEKKLDADLARRRWEPKLELMGGWLPEGFNTDDELELLNAEADRQLQPGGELGSPGQERKSLEREAFNAITKRRENGSSPIIQFVQWSDETDIGQLVNSNPEDKQ